MKLSTVETYFQNYLKTKQADIEPYIIEDNKLPVTTRLEIYFDGYRLRLLDILSNDFPKLFVLMGEEDFYHLAICYIEQHPSQHFSVRYFGNHLSSFLQNHNDYSKRPYLAEMAAFEWAMGDTLDSINIPTLPSQALKLLPLERFAELQVHFHPVTRLLHFNWDIPLLWKAIENNEPARPPRSLNSSEAWLVYRQGLECCFRSMSIEEGFAFKQMQQDNTIAGLCEALCSIMAEETIPAFILQCLDQWLKDDIIIDIF